MTVRLIALKCPQCSFALPAEPDEVAFACPQCGQVARLEGDGVVAQAAQWATPRAGATPERWLPFWAFPGRVQVTRRETQGFSLGGVLQGGEDPLWATARRLWVPAFALKLDHAQQWALSLTRAQPAFVAGPAPSGAPLHGCVVTLDAARRLAEFVVLSVEAARSDMLKDIAFQLPSEQPEFWLLPSDQHNLLAP
jgi:hypothetical protein